MAQTLKLKRSAVSGRVPTTSDLDLGEIAINTYDGKIFIKKNDGSDAIVTFEAGGGSTNAGTIEEDSFTGNGSTTGYTLTTAPSSEENVLVFIDATFQNRDSFTLSGTTITFDTAPDNGSSVRVYHVIPGTLDNGILTVAKFAASAIVTEAEGMSSNDNDTTIPTSAAVKDYVDTQVATVDTLPEVLANGNTTGGTDIAVSTGDDITFADSSKALFGAGSDLQIYHDGSFSYIKELGTGGLYLDTNGDGIYLRGTTGNENMVRALKDGAVTLYYDGSAKLATKSDGVDITGELQADSLDIDGLSYLTSANDATPLKITRGSATTDQAGVSFNAGGNTRFFGKGTDDEPYWATSANLTGGSKIVTAGNFTGILDSTYYQSGDNISVGTVTASGVIKTDLIQREGDGLSANSFLDFDMDTGGSSGTNNVVLAGVNNVDFLIDTNNNSTTGAFVFGTDATTMSSGTQLMTLDESGHLDLKTGNLKINGTSVIDTSRNIYGAAVQATSFSDGTISGITFIDEDSFATNSATRVPTQQSIKAYVDAEVAGIVDSAPSALNTLNELAAALGDDANFSTTTSDALGNRLRVDTASQGLTGTQQANAITNLGITATKAELNYVDGVTSNIQTQLDTKITSSDNITGTSGGLSGTPNITVGSITSSGDIKNGSYTRILTGDSNTGQLTFNADFASGAYTPDYNGAAAAGMSVIKMKAGGYGGLEFYVKKHGTASGTHALNTFTKVAEMHQDGYFDVSNTFKIGGTTVTSTAAELNYVDGVTSNIQTQLDSKYESGDNVSLGTIASGNITAGGSSTAAFLRAHYSDGSYMTLQGYGLEMNRTTSYIRPTTDGNKTLYVGGVDASLDWAAIHFRSLNGLYMTGTRFLTTDRNLENIGTINSGNITITTASVPLNFVESGHTGNGQYWRMPLDGGNLRFDVSLTGGASFTTYDNILQLNSDGSISVQGAQMFDSSGNINTTKTISSGDITTTGIQMGTGTSNDIQADGNTAFFGSAMFGTAASSNTPLKAVHIKGSGAQSIRIEDTASSNQIYDITSTYNGGLTIVDTTASITPLSIAHTTGHSTFSGTVTSPRLRLTATDDASPTSTTQAFQIGDYSSANMIIDDNEIMARNNGSPSTLNLQVEGGDIAIRAGVTGTTNLKMSGTTFMDHSRNLSNIGTISSGAITSSGRVTTGEDLRFSSTPRIRADNEINFLTNAGAAQVIKVLGAAAQTAYSGNSASSGMFNALNGYAVGTGNGTTVIDSSKNLTNINTISTGTVTISEGVSSGTFISLERSAGEIGRIAYSANDNIAIYGTNNHAGINFISAAIIPMQGSSELDDTIALGDSTRNFSEVFAKGMTVGSTQIIDASRNIKNIVDYHSDGRLQAASVHGQNTHIGGELLFEITDHDDSTSIKRKFGYNDSNSNFSKSTDSTAPASGVFDVYEYASPQWGPKIPIDDETEIIFECWAKHVSGDDTTGNFYVGGSFYDGSDTYLGNNNRYWGANGDALDATSGNDSWRHIKGVLRGDAIRAQSATSTAQFVQLLVLFNYNTGSGWSTNPQTTRYCGFKFYRSKKTVSSIYLKTSNGTTAYQDSNFQSTYAGTANLLVGPDQRLYANAVGTNTTPQFTFTGDTDTGFGYIAADSPGIIAGGSRKFYLNTTTAYFQNLSGGLQMSTFIDMNNNNISGVNALSFEDPGPNEGCTWSNIKIYESPDDLTTNSAGNFQVVYSGTRRLTVNSTGADVNGVLEAGASDNISMSSGSNGQFKIMGNGYTGAIALDGTAMHVYHNSSSRSLILGTNETARITIGGGGDVSFNNNNLTSCGNITADQGTFKSDSEALRVSSITNGEGATILFSDNGSPPALTSGQRGYIEYYHGDGASYGSGNSFVLTGTESTMTVLADGKLMFKEGLYTKPSSGTGAGTLVIDSSRNLHGNGIYAGSWSASTSSTVGRIGKVSDRVAGCITNQIGGSTSAKWEVVDYGWTKVLLQVSNAGLTVSNGGISCIAGEITTDAGVELGVGTGSGGVRSGYLAHLKSTGDAALLLEADSDNVTETDNAFIRFEQDGGAVAGTMGYRSGENALQIMNEYSAELYFGTANSLRGKFTNGGDFVTSHNITAYGSVSDIRRKENIEVIPNALEKVKTLDGITFNFKDRPGEKMTGVIAQQVMEVLPEAVYEHETMEKEQTYAVHYGNMVGLLIESIKEQQKQIDELKEEVSSLRSKN